MEDLPELLQPIMDSATTRHTRVAVSVVLEAHRKLYELYLELSRDNTEAGFIVSYNRFRRGRREE